MTALVRRSSLHLRKRPSRPPRGVCPDEGKTVSIQPACVLAIGGSDPIGGAGIQADLKTIHANGAWALTVVTSVTAQNSAGVRATHQLEAGIVAGQLTALVEDIEIMAIKTGMLGSAKIIECISDQMARPPLSACPLVVDPVLISSSGFSLLDAGGLEAMKRSLLPRARLCTPNRREAEALSGMPVGSLEEATEAARRIQGLGPPAVLIKGGHLAGAKAVDLLLDGKAWHRFEADRIAGPECHGTGCTLAAAVATWLGRGEELASAVARAKRFTTAAIRGAQRIGRGALQPDHFGSSSGGNKRESIGKQEQ